MDINAEKHEQGSLINCENINRTKSKKYDERKVNYKITKQTELFYEKICLYLTLNNAIKWD